MCLLKQQVMNSINQQKITVFNAGFFQVYENYSHPSQISTLDACYDALWKLFVLVSELWAELM